MYFIPFIRTTTRQMLNTLQFHLIFTMISIGSSSYPFYWWRNWGLQGLSDLLKITFISKEDNIWTHQDTFDTPSFSSLAHNLCAIRSSHVFPLPYLWTLLAARKLMRRTEACSGHLKSVGKTFCRIQRSLLIYLWCLLTFSSNSQMKWKCSRFVLLFWYRDLPHMEK